MPIEDLEAADIFLTCPNINWLPTSIVQFDLLNRSRLPPLYHVSGIFISPGGDMAAVYGSIENPAKTGSYLRIWRFEKTGWKIALEVIRI